MNDGEIVKILRVLIHGRRQILFLINFCHHSEDMFLKILFPIEVKNSQDIKIDKLKGLMIFLKKYKQKSGIAIYQGEIKQRKIEDYNILFHPLWIFAKILER